MSSYVWEHSEQKGTGLLLMLAIADHAHDDGGGAYPSVATLARKARTTPRHIKRLLPQLEAAEELTIQRGKGPHGTNIYQVTICPPKVHDGSNDGSGDAGVTRSVHEMSPPGARMSPYDLEAYIRRND